MKRRPNILTKKLKSTFKGVIIPKKNTLLATNYKHPSIQIQ